MKKILALFAALMLATLAFGGAANATPGGGGPQPSADNKPVTFCHATASKTNPYEKITTSVSAFINAGHVGHAGDIYPEIKYTTKGGQVVTIPAQGDQSLLAFDDCQPPKVDEKIAKPEPTFVDKCGTKDDVFAVSPGRGYTVGAVVNSSDGTQSITVTVLDGFVFVDGNTSVTYTKPGFTDVDCDLPETGGIATVNSAGGVAALIALGFGAVMMITGGKRRKTTA